MSVVMAPTRPPIQELRGVSKWGGGGGKQPSGGGQGSDPSTGWVCTENVKFLLSSAGRGIWTPVSKAFHTPPRMRHEGGQS